MVNSKTIKHKYAVETISEKSEKLGKKSTFLNFLDGGGCKTTQCINGKVENVHLIFFKANMVSEIVFSKRGCKKSVKAPSKNDIFEDLKQDF